MKKTLINRKLPLLAVIILIFSMSVQLCAGAIGQETATNGSGELPYESYTYWVDYNASEKTQAYSKPMYAVKKVIFASELGNIEGCKYNDVAADTNGNIYLLDSGSSKVYIFDKSYTLTKKLENLTFNNESLAFTDAKGIYVDRNGNIYIADTENARVIVINSTGTVTNLLYVPQSEKIPTGFEYRPIKVTVDSKNYTYIASDGSYYGAVLYSPDMEFLGFYGANTVKATVGEAVKRLWDRLFSNDVKRAADELSLPYSFTDIVCGTDDFVYTATGRSGDDVIQHGQIAMLNPGGKDILGASDYNFADVAVGALQRSQQIQDLSGIDVDSDGYFYALDSTYGRIFWYDEDYNLLSVFGGSFGDGDQKGTFKLASGIAVNGTDVVISDSQANSLTVFAITDYGKLVRDSQLITLSGDFAAAESGWLEVIKQDNNSQLAYRGLAKAYYDKKEYSEAMEYAQLGSDRETYSNAFKKQRTVVLEDNFAFIFIGVIVIVGGIISARVYLRRKHKILVGNTEIRLAFGSVAHPVDTFRTIKEKKRGSLIISTVILLLFYVATVLNDTAGGFAFTVFDSSSYNALYVFLSTVGTVVLWTAANWLVCTLNGGIGKLREIYIVTCYCLIPIVFAYLCRLLLTHILIPEEGAFLGVFIAVCVIYAVFMLIAGIMRIHDYEFGKFVGTTVLTLISMMIIIFLMFLIFLLSQQVFGWLQTIYIELKYR